MARCIQNSIVIVALLCFVTLAVPDDAAAYQEAPLVTAGVRAWSDVAGRDTVVGEGADSARAASAAVQQEIAPRTAQHTKQLWQQPSVSSDIVPEAIVESSAAAAEDNYIEDLAQHPAGTVTAAARKEQAALAYQQAMELQRVAQQLVTEVETSTDSRTAAAARDLEVQLITERKKLQEEAAAVGAVDVHQEEDPAKKVARGKTDAAGDSLSPPASPEAPATAQWQKNFQETVGDYNFTVDVHLHREKDYKAEMSKERRARRKRLREAALRRWKVRKAKEKGQAVIKELWDKAAVAQDNLARIEHDEQSREIGEAERGDPPASADILLATRTTGGSTSEHRQEQEQEQEHSHAPATSSSSHTAVKAATPKLPRATQHGSAADLLAARQADLKENEECRRKLASEGEVQQPGAAEGEAPCRSDVRLLLPERAACHTHQYHWHKHSSVLLSHSSGTPAAPKGAGMQSEAEGSVTVTKLGSTADGADVMSLHVDRATEKIETDGSPRDVTSQVSGGAFVFVQARSGEVQQVYKDPRDTPSQVHFKQEIVSQLTMTLRQPVNVSASYSYDVRETHHTGERQLMRYKVMSEPEELVVVRRAAASGHPSGISQHLPSMQSDLGSTTMRVNYDTGVPVLSITTKTSSTAPKPTNAVNASSEMLSELRLLGTATLDAHACSQARLRAKSQQDGVVGSDDRAEQPLEYHSVDGKASLTGLLSVPLTPTAQQQEETHTAAGSRGFQSGLSRAQIAGRASDSSRKIERMLVQELNQLSNCLADPNVKCEREQQHLSTVEALFRLDPTGNTALLLGDILKQGACPTPAIAIRVLEMLSSQQRVEDQAVLRELLTSTSLPLAIRIHHIATKFLTFRNPTLPIVLALETLYRSNLAHPLAPVLLSILGALTSRVPEGDHTRARLLALIEDSLSQQESSLPALAALGNARPSSAHLQILQKHHLQASADRDTRIQATIALRHAPPEADHMLKNLATSDEDPEVRRMASRMLAIRQGGALQALASSKLSESPSKAAANALLLQAQQQQQGLPSRGTISKKPASAAVWCPLCPPWCPPGSSMDGNGFCTEDKIQASGGSDGASSSLQVAHAGLVQYEPHAEEAAQAVIAHEHAALKSLGNVASEITEMANPGKWEKAAHALHAAESLMEAAASATEGAASQTQSPWNATLDLEAIATSSVLGKEKLALVLTASARHRHDSSGGEDPAAAAAAASVDVQPYLLVYGMQLFVPKVKASAPRQKESIGVDADATDKHSSMATTTTTTTFEPCGELPTAPVYRLMQESSDDQRSDDESDDDDASDDASTQVRGIWSARGFPDEQSWTDTQQIHFHAGASLNLIHTLHFGLTQMASSCARISEDTRMLAMEPTVRTSVDIQGQIQLLRASDSATASHLSSALSLSLLDARAPVGVTFAQKFLSNTCPQGAGSLAAHVAMLPSHSRLTVADTHRAASRLVPGTPCWPHSPVTDCAAGACKSSWIATQLQARSVELPGSMHTPFLQLLSGKFLSSTSEEERQQCLSILRDVLEVPHHVFRSLMATLSHHHSVKEDLASKLAESQHLGQWQKLAAVLNKQPLSSYRFAAPTNAVLVTLSELSEERNSRSARSKTPLTAVSAKVAMEELATWASNTVQTLHEGPHRDEDWVSQITTQLEEASTTARSLISKSASTHCAGPTAEEEEEEDISKISRFKGVCRRIEGQMSALEECVPRTASGAISKEGLWGGAGHRCDSVRCGKHENVCGNDDTTATLKQCWPQDGPEGRATCKACRNGETTLNEAHTCTDVCEEHSEQCRTSTICTPKCTKAKAGCASTLSCLASPAPLLRSAEALELIVPSLRSAAEKEVHRQGGVTQGDVDRWAHVSGILMEEASALGLESAADGHPRHSSNGRSLLSDSIATATESARGGGEHESARGGGEHGAFWPPKGVEADPDAVLVMQTIVSSDAFLCVDSAKGSALQMIGQTCGDGNNKIQWAGFRKLSDAKGINRLCGVPGAVPEVHEYLGSCGVAPVRLPHLPTAVCGSEGAQAGCVEKSQLLQACTETCKDSLKERTVCHSDCNLATHCTPKCAKLGRACQVQARRVCV